MAINSQLSDRQKQIIESAIKLIAEEGLVNLTTKKLAKAVNVSEPALYRHFENKEAIILGLIKYINEKTQEIFDFSDNIENKAAIEVLEIKCKALIEFFQKNIFCAKTSANPGMFFPNKEILNEISKLEKSIFENKKIIVEKGQKEGDIKSDLDSAQLVKIIMGVHSLIIHKWAKSEQNYDLLNEWMDVWKVLKKMIAAER